MLKLFFLVASATLALTNAATLFERQVSPSSLTLCVDREYRLNTWSSVNIKTPNFDNAQNYLDNTHCNVILSSGAEALLLTVRLNTIDLENEPSNCMYDDLCLNGVKFCGNWASGSTYNFILPAYRTFTINFKSDGSVTGRGVNATVSAVSYQGQTVNVANSGVGSSSASIHFSPINGSYMYNDACAAEATQLYTNYYTGSTDYYTTPYYYPTNSDYYMTTYYYTSPYYPTSTSYYYGSTYYYTSPYYSTPYYYPDTTYYYTSPYHYTTDYYYTTPYTTWYPWYDTTPIYYSTTNYWYDTTPNYYTTEPWWYYTTHYNTDYYYTTNYYPWSTSSRSNDYIASVLRDVISQLNAEQFNQQQAINNLNIILQYLGY